MPTNDKTLLQLARAVATSERRVRRLKRQLKAARADLKLDRRALRALTRDIERRADIMPSKLFGDGVGYVVPPVKSNIP